VVWHIIVNPAAGSGKAGRKWPALEKQIADLVAIGSIQYTQYKGHATELAQIAIAEGARYILAVGGDGTIHEVLNGVMQQKTIPTQAITLALFPIGTGNDWIKTHGIPKRHDQWFDYFKNGRARSHSAGRIAYQTDEGPAVRYFWNVAGLSYDGFVVEYVESRKKLVFHSSIYLLFIVWCLFRFKIPRGQIQFNHEERRGRFYTINIGVGRYSGGGLRLTPHAQHDGDTFGLTIAGAVSKLEVVRSIGHFFKGTLGQHPQVEEHHTKRIRIDAIGDIPMLVEADGEFLGRAPVAFEHLPEAVRFWAPDK
jgi:diacylglycerol kinase (ATP)